MEENAIQALITGDSDKASGALRKFLENNSQTFSFPELNHNNYRKDLWKALYGFIKNPKLKHLYVDTLGAIRILSRDKTHLSEVINGDLLNCIIEHAAIKDDLDFDNKTTHLVAVEALKCLCNLIYNCPVAAAISCKNGTLDGIIRRLRTYRDPKVPPDIKFFDIKILFLLSALCSEIRPRLKEDLHGLTYLIETLDLILKEPLENNHNADIHQGFCHKLKNSQIDLCCEILKVLFNLTLRDSPMDEEEEAHNLRLVGILHDLLLVDAECVEKKRELTNHIVNLLTNMPNSCISSLITPVLDGKIVCKELQFEEHDMSAIYEIINFLQSRFFCDPTVGQQCEQLSPVLTALLKCSVANRLIRKYLRNRILPPLRDVHHRPEEGCTLRNSMCRLLTSPITQVRDLTAELLFVLCKESVNRMIKYTGYGNAAGMFATRGLLGGKNGDVSKYSSDSEDSDTEEYKQYKHGINPVVGCYEAPRSNPTEGMSEEQKEYEAMKLVELMDNLTRTGMVKPCKIGEDGRPEAIEHVLQLQEGLRDQQIHMDDDSD